MPACRNDKTKTYTGREASPRGLGYCAQAEIDGKVRKGRDGRRWVARADRAGRLSWRAPLAGGAVAVSSTPRVVPTVRAATVTHATANVQALRAPAPGRIALTRMEAYASPSASTGASPGSRAPDSYEQTPRFEDGNACIDLNNLLDQAEGEISKRGQGQCAQMAKTMQIVAGIKVGIAAISMGDEVKAAQMSKVADSALNIAFRKANVGKDFDVSNDWETILKRAAHAVALKCFGLDPIKDAVAREAQKYNVLE